MTNADNTPSEKNEAPEKDNALVQRGVFLSMERDETGAERIVMHPVNVDPMSIYGIVMNASKQVRSIFE